MAKSCEKVKTLNAFVVEDHHEVVPVIHRAIGSKVLPFQDITLVHFDSHPDLLIPIDMAADQVFNKDDLYRTLSIENWIIPLVYAGHISDIFWIKPPWAQQVPDGTISFKVGKCKKTGTIRTTCRENYFISELLFSTEENLDNMKPVTLTVLTVRPDCWKTEVLSDQNNSNQNIQYEATPQFEYLIKTLKVKKFILDIDLDFYSTKNPFKEVYNDRQYAILKQLYTCSPIQNTSDQGVERFINDRRCQLNDIKKLLLSGAIDTSIRKEDNTRAILVKELLEDLERNNKEYDKDLVHEAGCTIDDSELPHHISTTQEIIQLVQTTKDILETIVSRPCLITLSRSSDDDYCPPDQVDYIEESICMIIEECYVYVDIKRLYENETSD